MREDVTMAFYGFYFLEIADYYSRESMSAPKLIKLLYYALTALTRPSIPHRLTRRIYELRIMKIDGQYDAEPAAVGKVGETTAFTWNFILNTPLEKLFTFTLKDDVLEELEECVDRSLRKYVDKKMNSLEILESIAGK